MRSVGKPCGGCPRRKLNNEIISFHFFKINLLISWNQL
jgi:predicted small metal-binding protein